MKILTEQEYETEMYSGTGMSHFMGGCSSENGKQIVVVYGTPFLFEKEEVGNKEYMDKISEMEAESKKHLEAEGYI